MADDGWFLLLAGALDVALTRGAKRHVWIRVLNSIAWVLIVVLIAGLIYVTFKYS